MAAQSIYIPFYKDGAWHWCKLNGTYDTGQKVPEGEPAVHSKAMTHTPPPKLQPDPGA